MREWSKQRETRLRFKRKRQCLIKPVTGHKSNNCLCGCCCGCNSFNNVSFGLLSLSVSLSLCLPVSLSNSLVLFLIFLYSFCPIRFYATTSLLYFCVRLLRFFCISVSVISTFTFPIEITHPSFCGNSVIS